MDKIGATYFWHGVLLGAAMGIVTGAAIEWLEKPKTPNKEVENSADGNYLSVPGGGRVYKFYDDVGAVCFVAQNASQNSISIYCIPGE